MYGKVGKIRIHPSMSSPDNPYSLDKLWSFDNNTGSRPPNMFRNKSSKREDVKKSAGKVLDTKKDTATRAKVIIEIFSINRLG